MNKWDKLRARLQKNKADTPWSAEAAMLRWILDYMQDLDAEEAREIVSIEDGLHG